MVTGLLRVDRNLTCAILRTSGQKAQNNRWFFEPLRYDDKLSAPFDKLPLTTWVEDKGKGLEQSAADAEIQTAKVGMGLKLGYRQVGVRQKRPAESESQPRIRIWRATSVPRGVDVEDVENIMTAAGFSNFEALEKFRWKQDSGYVKAVRSDSQDVFEVKYGNTIISVGLQDRRHPKQANKPYVYLPNERKIKFHHNADTAVSATILDTQTEEEDNAMETSDANNGKRSAQAKEAHAKKARSCKTMEGFNEESNAGQGDCLFWSISQALNKHNVCKSMLQCRAMAVTHLRKYREAYHPHWDGNFPKKETEAVPNRDFGKYLDEVAKEKAWGSALEVMALSFTLDRPIFVLRPGQETYLFNRDGKRKPLYLKYQDEHYTCLHHTGVSEPQLDTVIDGPHCGIRGAAATVVSSVGTRSTVKRRFPCPFQRNAKAPTSAGTRKSVQMNLKNVA